VAGTYPPPNQVLSVLGIEVTGAADGGSLGRVAVDHSLLGRGDGPPGVGCLVPIVDLVAGSAAARLTEGDWLVTTDVWLYERNPLNGGRIEAESRLLRSGKRSTVMAVEVTAAGVPIVSSTISFSRIRRDAANVSADTPRPDGEWIRLGSGPLLDEPLETACRFRRVEPGSGIVEIDRSPFVNNSIGTLQGGVVALLADVAAADLVGPRARTTELQFRFLAQTADGPARTNAEVVRRDGDGVTVNVEVTDSSDGRLVGWATCRVTP
jgi:acyl-coenzyme A thioesterase PaaI-like protein